MLFFCADYKNIRECLPSIAGIYKICDNIKMRTYYGSTSNLRKRFYDHRRKMKRNIHDNPIIQNIFNKYGSHSLFFEIVELCQKEERFLREQYYIDLADKDTLMNIVLDVTENKTNTNKSQLSIQGKYILTTKAPWNKKYQYEIGQLSEEDKTIKEYFRNIASRTKLSWEIVEQIRKRYEEVRGTMSMREIAKEFNIDCSQISRIVNNVTWRR